MEIFVDKNTDADDKKEDIEKGGEENMDMLMADSYSYVVAIMYIR